MRGYIYKILVLIPVLLILNSLLLFQDSKAQWMQMNAPSNIFYCFAISGMNVFSGSNSGGVYISTDNGMNWTQCSNSLPSINTIAVSGLNVFAGNGDGGGPGGLFRSTNNGVNWIALNSGLPDIHVRVLTVFGTNILAGLNYGGVYLSTDNGMNWNIIGSNFGEVNSFAISGSNIFAGTYYSGIYLSTNNGTNWTAVNNGIIINNAIVSLTISGTNLFAGTGGYGVYYSSNNGTNWLAKGLNGRTVGSLLYSGTNVFAGTDTGVFLSSNNGTNWIQVNQGFNPVPLIHSLTIINNYILAASRFHGIWRRPLSEIITSVQNISTEIPLSFSLSQNYPNPFNPTTTIKFDIKAGFLPSTRDGNDKVVLKVFDILGKEVATLVNEQLAPGTYSVDWNASAFPSGVYFYRLTTEGFSETKKMLMIK